MSDITVNCEFHLKREKRGARKAVRTGTSPAVPVGRIPRVSKLMALAIRFEEMVRNGEVDDYATLARLGHVSRARITQIMNLVSLAPEIQEAILCLPRIESGRDRLHLRDLQPVARQVNWGLQRQLWQSARKPRTKS